PEEVRRDASGGARAGAHSAHSEPSSREASGRARPCAPDRPASGPRAGSPGGGANETKVGDTRPRSSRPAPEPGGRRSPHDAGLARDRRRPSPAQVPAEASTPARDLRALRRLDFGDERKRL